jgi:hypothetical protein
MLTCRNTSQHLQYQTTWTDIISTIKIRTRNRSGKYVRIQVGEVEGRYRLVAWRLKGGMHGLDQCRGQCRDRSL